MRVRGPRRPRPINIRPMPLPKGRISRKWGAFIKIYCRGGPYKGERIIRRALGDTLVVVVRGEAGHYNAVGDWLPFVTEVTVA